MGASLFGIETSLNQEVESSVSLKGTETDQTANDV